MTLVPSTAASAVYHDALTTARKFRTLCFLVLFLVLVAQIALFFGARYSPEVRDAIEGRGEVSLTTPTGVDSEMSREVEADGDIGRDLDIDVETTQTKVSSDKLQGAGYMAVYATLWLGLVFSLLMSLTLAFITLVMLNGRTVGVTNVAKAFLYSLLLLLLMIPWQAILTHPTLKGGPWRVPGALYTWPELLLNVPEFQGGAADWLGWVRFVVWPAVALLLLLIVTFGSGRGIKSALGEDLPDLDDERPVS